jgi:hypothetical protein
MAKEVPIYRPSEEETTPLNGYEKSNLYYVTNKNCEKCGRGIRLYKDRLPPNGERFDYHCPCGKEVIKFRSAFN